MKTPQSGCMDSNWFDFSGRCSGVRSEIREMNRQGQKQIPFDFAHGRLSTHHPQTEER
jgi:hypothetical protein